MDFFFGISTGGLLESWLRISTGSHEVQILRLEELGAYWNPGTWVPGLLYGFLPEDGRGSLESRESFLEFFPRCL